jgi:DNA-directed RNA polymerase sigma subunit (sigma70/sigma32)
MITNKPPIDEKALIQYALANPHLSMEKIGKVFDRSDKTVFNILKRNNIKKKFQPYSPKAEANVINTFNKLGTIGATKKKLKISGNTVSKILKKYNIQYSAVRKGTRKPDLTPSQKEMFDTHTHIVKLAISRLGKWRFKYAGLEYDDVYSAGMVGLWRATLTYNKKVGTVFSTLAYKAIVGEILEAIEVARFGKRQRGNTLIDQSKFVSYQETWDEDK